MKKIFGFAVILAAMLFCSCGSTNYQTGLDKYSPSNSEDFSIPSTEDGNLLIKRNFKASELVANIPVFLDGEYIGLIKAGKYWQGNIPEGAHEIAVAAGSHGSTVNQYSSYSKNDISKVKVTISNEKTTIIWVKMDGFKAKAQEMPF